MLPSLNVAVDSIPLAVYAQLPVITALYAFVVLTCEPPDVCVQLDHAYPSDTVAPRVTVYPVI